MGLWLFYVETICLDSHREKEFNTWYDEIHIPDVMGGCPEFLTCRRYQLMSGEGKRQYLVTIEIETEDIDRTMKTHRQNSEKIRREGRWSDLVHVLSRRLYKLDKEL